MSRHDQLANWNPNIHGEASEKQIYARKLEVKRFLAIKNQWSSSINQDPGNRCKCQILERQKNTGRGKNYVSKQL